MKTVYLALGTNLGDREQNLQTAVERIAAAGVVLTLASSVYETKPMYRGEQPMFLNMVVEGQTDLMPRVLLKKMQSIEKEMGRRRTVENGPRVIDIDILFYGRFRIDTPGLVVPHPRIGERRFVLEPMAEIAPQWRHPANAKRISEMLEKVRDQTVKKVAFQVALR